VSEPRRASLGHFLGAAVLGGAVVGVVDGLRAALTSAVDLAGGVACLLFVVGLDVAVGALLGALAVGVVFAVRWGRAVAPPRWAEVAGLALGGTLTGLAAVAAVAATAMRNNRFLAAGLVALTVAIVGALGATLAPAFARLLGFGPRRTVPLRPPTAAGLFLLAPLVTLVLAAAVFVPVAGARAPLRGARYNELAAAVAGLAALVPIAIALVVTRLPRIKAQVGLAAGALAFGIPAVVLVVLRWTKDFQFVRWNDFAVLAALALVTFGPGLAVARRFPARRVVGVALTAAGLGLVALFAGGASEPARKAAGTRAGLAAPFLAAAPLALDLDRDGYTSLLGGGDCQDRDPEINPGAQEWPGDEIDQNCDGKDAAASSIRALPLHPVPDAVPRDLNLLFITVDTLRADHLGSYGYGRPTSPEMDRLAAEGTLFENGWAHAPSTRYSMPALATGRWPSAIAWEDCAGCERSWPRIAPGQVTLGTALKANGYFTGAYYAFEYFKRDYRRGFERGIDDYQDKRADLHRGPTPMESSGTSAREMADDAIAFFEQHQTGKWFLWLHFYDPHLDYHRHPDAPQFGASQADLYDAEIWYTDQHIGRVIARLKALGLWDRTAIVLTGDHGEGLGEHGITAHGYHLYPPQTKVPFIARVPGVPPRRVKTPVSHVDVAPTLLNLARAPAEKSFLGRSMLDLMTGTPWQAVPIPPVFQEVTYEGPTSPIDGTRRRGLITADRHLIWNWMPDNTTECYDLVLDPAETRDLWGSAAGKDCVALKAQLQDLVQALSFPLDLGERLAAAVTPAGVTPPAPAHKLEARFGTALAFAGYDLNKTEVTRGPDAEVEVVYHFDVRDRVPKGWFPFFHLDGPGGMRNLDHAPVGGAYPVERWRPGQRIRDQQRIVIPADMAPGTYTIHVGFFRRNERMPIDPPSLSDGASRLRVATITVR
jgi:choline-sulfatase